MTDDDFRRLETKVDKLTDAVSKLILVEERLANQGERIGRVEQSVAVIESHSYKVERKLDQWVNRGIGVWGLAVTLFALVQYGSRWVGK